MPGCGKNPVSQIVDLDGIWEGKQVDYTTNLEEGQPQNVMTELFFIQVFCVTFSGPTSNGSYRVQ